MSVNVFGLGSGIDFQAMIDAVIQAEQAKVARTITQKAVSAQSQQVVFQNAKGALNSLDAAIKDFQFAQDLKTKKAKSSDETKFTAIATLNAPIQTTKIEVAQLANNEEARMSFASTDSIVHSGSDTTITINVRGVDKTVDVPSGTTLAELATLINKAGIGVSANTYDSGDGTATPARLTIKDNQLGDYDGGTDNIVFTAFSSQLDQISSDPSITTAAQDSEVIIGEGAGEETITFSSHTLSGVIPGVTLKLLSESPTGEKETLTISEDISNASTKMKNLVDRYNEAVTMLRQATAFDLTQDTQTNPTAGDSTLRGVLTRLQTAITGQITSLPDGLAIHSLTELGITSVFSGDNTSANGTLEFDASKFNAALENNYDDLIKFFEGFTEDSVTYNGWSDQMIDVMSSFLRSPDGAIVSKISSLDTQLKRLSEEQTDALERIAQKEEFLTQKYARLESQLSALNGQQSQLEASIQSISLTNQAIANKKR